MPRRSRSKEKKTVSSKLRMDSKPDPPRITDPSLPAARRREIDNVMKKARAQTSPTAGAFWDKKLLEVEAKDPNRWRHSGYKSLYIDGSSSASSSRGRSRSRSPIGRGGLGRSPPSPPPPRRGPQPRSPPPTRGPRSPPHTPPSHHPRGGRPRSPPPPRRSPTPASSVSSCSDDSCSVCSPKHRRVRSRSRSYSPVVRSRSRRPSSPPPRPSRRSGGRPPSPSPSPPPPRRGRPTTPPQAPPRGRPSTPPHAPPGPPPHHAASSSDRPTDPRRRPPPPPLPRGSSGKVIDVKGVKPNAKPPPGKMQGKAGLLTRIKKEGSRKKRPGSPDSTGSDDSSSNSMLVVPIVATTGMNLSERFGKIAQWSADKERRDIENMRITKTGSNMKVMVEEDDFLYGSPPRSLSPGILYPEGGPMSPGGAAARIGAWDDVRVRYQYYKELGYLRDLTLDDYVKWEEWWYKYQEWLANERHYEAWLESQAAGGRSSRRRRKKAADRLN